MMTRNLKELKTIIITVLFSLICVSVQAQDYPQLRIPNTEERALYSEIMDYEYGVYVTLPADYFNNPKKNYPTLYIIDGNQYYVFTHEPYNSLVWGNMVKEHIAISVAYRPGQLNHRGRDFRCTHRAADFVKFFQDELIPYVEDNYRTSKEDRTLFGHSLGGHFTLFMLLNAPGTFENYIVSAPSVSDEIMEFEEEYAATHNDLPVKVFLASGENDHLTIGAKRFAEKFKSRAYPGLKYREIYINNGNHGTIQPTAYIEGLRFVLDPVIELTPEKIERLAGCYVEGDNKYTLIYDGGNFLRLEETPELYEAWSDSPFVEWNKIYPVSETLFVSKGWEGAFTFGGDLSSPAETFKFSYRNNHVKAIRQ